MHGRRSINYGALHEKFRTDPGALYLNQVDLRKLFLEERVNDLLLRLETFRGIWQKCTRASLQKFSELLEYVPQELTCALARVTEFWEGLANLCEYKMNILEDELTAKKIEGLWPACCSADMDRFRELMKSTLFPYVQDQESRDRIKMEIENLSYRVPSLGILVPESRALNRIVKRLLKGLPENYELLSSKIVNKQTEDIAADEKQYYLCFLAAARACGHNDEQLLQRELEDILHSEPACESLRLHLESLGYPAGKFLVSEPPYGVWATTLPQGKQDSRCPSIIDCFHLMVLCHLDSGSYSFPKQGKTKVPFLTISFLAKDFFESFFGPANCFSGSYHTLTGTDQEAWTSDEDILAIEGTPSPLLADLSSNGISPMLHREGSHARRVKTVEPPESHQSLKVDVRCWPSTSLPDITTDQGYTQEAWTSDDETMYQTDTPLSRKVQKEDWIINVVGNTGICAESVLVDGNSRESGSPKRTQETSVVRSIKIPKHNWRGLTYESSS